MAKSKRIKVDGEWLSLDVKQTHNRKELESIKKLGLKPIVKEKSVGRNELCPCESGKKHKKCCL